MIWDTVKRDLLAQLHQRIDSRADVAERDSLRNLCAAFYGRFPAEDMRDRSVENLYGCLYGLLHLLRTRPDTSPRIQIFNPEIQSHGWECKYTVVAIACRGIPFCTASVRGELNRRNLTIHTIASSNLPITRDATGELAAVLTDAEGSASGLPEEAVLYFEIGRHSRPDELEELRHTLSGILQEVALVVDDFPAMSARLQEAERQVQASDCVDEPLRTEAAAFLAWLQQAHMTMLGYEYLEVQGAGEPGQRVEVAAAASLGLLRHRTSRGAEDLGTDLMHMSADELRRRQLSFSKSRNRSRVHRLTYPDYIEVKVFSEAGRIVGQHRFIGLYTSSVYTMNPREIPILRRKVERVMQMSSLDSSDHESRELERVLELFPRDELFQSSIQELYDTVTAVNRIQERPQIRLFVRRDPHHKFVNCIVYIPRDRYNTELREKIEHILCTAFGAQEREFTTHFSESILVRCHFVLRVDPNTALDFDAVEIEGQIVQATLAWEDRLRIRLVEEFGEENGEQYVRELAAGFPPGYRDDFDPRVAVLDIKQILRLQRGEELTMSLYRLVEEADEILRLRLYHVAQSLPLSDVLPILENLGLRVMTERPYGVRASGGRVYWIQEFTLIYALSHNIVLETVKQEFEEAFARIWFGASESDCFNRLLLGTRLDWREIGMLRAYARYLRQVHFPFSVDYIAETLANHLQLTGSLVELFLTRFSPDFEGDSGWRLEREKAVEQRILNSLERVENLGEDRIIRQYVMLIKATQRTNFFQRRADGTLKSCFSFKLKPAEIPGIPKPVPLYEIYVYSPRVEGVHLRGGKVARGGLRWSDRFEDFRTEVLGLVKAQQVKNAVIVPVGAKGGFVARQLRPGMSREEIQREGIACYQMYIRALLDITDNRSADEVIRPSQVVVKDEDDPYLVVAADKGTASFSDIANEISAEYKFWLGDAFASGGSAGYDHKKMGITARGAWVSVQRHFREMDLDVQATDFSVVGIGDMAGDVFGNGMLMSEHIRLVAAFNHMHVFVDPEPDAAASFTERRRLFELPGSGWGDYNNELISVGGGVFPRAAKSIQVSPEMQARFDIQADQLTPNELISHLLRARVDLLWNGGIGTYVKAGTESHTAVGDKSNDGLRVDASQLRCRVIGEGGNLGMTQLARVEYCLAGGRCNTDFVDNAGGVDCSDHEVNIKILLNAVVARGDLTEKHRNLLLAQMTESVAELVLNNIYHQVQAISMAEFQALERGGEYQRFIRAFEEAGRLDRRLEFLPSDEELLERRLQGQALTRPELAVLISYSKAVLKEQLIESDLDGDPYLALMIVSAFPQRLVDEYRSEILGHRLHREIMATQLANDIVNRMGISYVQRQQAATGAVVADVARAYISAMEIYGIRELWGQVEALDHQVSSAIQMELMLNVIRLIKRATRWLLRNRRHQLKPTDCVAGFAAGLEQLREAYPGMLRGRAAKQFQALYERFLAGGVAPDLAQEIAAADHAYTALGIIQATGDTEAPLMEVAGLYFFIGERLELDWFGDLILSSKVDNEWQALARDTYLEDLEWQQRTLAIGALRHMGEDRNLLKCVNKWELSEALLLQRWRQMLAELHASPTPDFAMFAVANRELLDLAQSSMVVK
ncbi:MAG: NAD-glutamate dehydrogenase [Halioglobus sp.]|nr:NAD-glutamate dehydrogenase [Halioglobus sp.]